MDISTHSITVPENFIVKPIVIPDNVKDIDADDTQNPQLATEYVNEIYSYMRYLEVSLSCISPFNFGFHF